MKCLFLLPIFSLLLLTSCTPPGPNPEEMIAGAKELDQRWLAAFNRADVDAMMDCYLNSPEFISFDVGTMISRGYDAARTNLSEMLADMQGGTLSLTESHYQPAGKYVISWGLWNYSMPMPDGNTMNMAGRFTDVKTENNGKWVYIHDHASVPLPPRSGDEAE